MNKIFALLCLLIGLLYTFPANAVPVTYAYSIDYNGTASGGHLQGSFSFDSLAADDGIIAHDSVAPSPRELSAFTINYTGGDADAFTNAEISITDLMFSYNLNTDEFTLDFMGVGNSGTLGVIKVSAESGILTLISNQAGIDLGFGIDVVVTPIPTTIWMFLAGLLGLILMRRTTLKTEYKVNQNLSPA